MAELAPADVESYTQGQLQGSDPETQRMLDAVLAAARRDVRWHVSPIVYGDVITLNAHGSNRLRLPTKQVINIDSITNDGVALDPTTDVTLDAESGNLLYLNSGRWSSAINGVVVTMDHGFPEDSTVAAGLSGYTGLTADDWRQAILNLVASAFQIVASGRPDAELEAKQIDDVVYRWAATASLPMAEPILVQYRLLWKWV